MRPGALSPPAALLRGAAAVTNPRAVGAGVWVWGPNTVPLACMPCGGCVPRGGGGLSTGPTVWYPCEPPLRTVAAAEGRPRVSSAVVVTVLVQALPLPRLPAFWAGCRGPLPACCGGGCASVGVQHCPLGSHAPCRAACRGGGRGPSPGGWPSTVARGARCQALSLFCGPSSGTGGRGSATRVSWVRSVWAWGPSTGPTPYKPLMRAVGAEEGRPRGGAFHRCEVRVSLGASPPPAARPLGPLSVSAAHVLRVRPCGCRGPALSPWLACPVGAACRGSGGGASPGGVACHRCEGCLVAGAVPPPTARPLGRAAGVPRPVHPGRGWCGPGDPAPAPQRAPLPAVVARCGGGGRASPRGVPRAVARDM